MNNLLKLILRSYCINYPVLLDLKCVCMRPIALVFENISDIAPFVESIGLYSRLVDFSTSRRVLMRYLMEANSEGVFFYISPEATKTRPTKVEEKVALISASTQFNCVDGVQTCVPGFYCFYRIIPPDFLEQVFVIKIEDCKNTDLEDEIMELVPDSSQLGIIQDKLKDILDKETEEPWLVAAVAFMYPKLKVKNHMELYNDLLAEVYRLVRGNELYHENDSVTELIMDYLLALATDGEFWDLLDLSVKQTDLGEDSRCYEGQYYFRGQYLYIAERRFKKLLDPILQSIPIDMVKEELLNAGILLGDGQNYTTKMNFMTTEGVLRRIRMMKFDMKKIVNESGFTLENYIRM